MGLARPARAGSAACGSPALAMATVRAARISIEFGERDRHVGRTEHQRYFGAAGDDRLGAAFDQVLGQLAHPRAHVRAQVAGLDAVEQLHEGLPVGFAAENRLDAAARQAILIEPRFQAGVGREHADRRSGRRSLLADRIDQVEERDRHRRLDVRSVGVGGVARHRQHLRARPARAPAPCPPGPRRGRGDRPAGGGVAVRHVRIAVDDQAQVVLIPLGGRKRLHARHVLHRGDRAHAADHADHQAHEREHVLIGEEGRRAAGVDEQHPLARLQLAAAGQADQAGHGLAGIDRIEQHAVEARQHLHRFHHLRCGERVARPDPLVQGDHRLARDRRHAQLLRRGLRPGRGHCPPARHAAGGR